MRIQAEILASATTVIYACVNPTTSVLSLSTKAATCPNGGSKIHWNQRGSAGLIWMGAWTSGVTYSALDAVQYQGSAYIVPSGSTSATPPSSPWQLLAAQGAQGLPGPPGISGLVVIVANGEDAACPAGKQAISGGGSIDAFNGEAFMVQSFPTGNPPAGWHVQGKATLSNPGSQWNTPWQPNRSLAVAHQSRAQLLFLDVEGSTSWRARASVMPPQNASSRPG